MRRSLLFVLLFGTGFLLPQSVRGLDQKTVNERTRQIQMMSKFDRDRLNRNIATFQSLSAAEKSRLELLHVELQSDRATAGGLSALLQTYSAWLQSLSPVQQEEIRKETDPARRLALVGKFKEELEQSKSTQEVPAEETAASPPNQKFPFRGALDSKDLAAVIKSIADRFPQERLKPDFDRPVLDSYLQTIHASARSSGSYQEWPDDALLQKMIASIKNKETTLIVQKSSLKRDFMIRAVLMGIMRQAFESVAFPTDEERLQTYESLTALEKQQLISLPQDMVVRRLNQRYFEAKKDDSFKKLPGYQRQVIELFDRFEVQPPPGRFQHQKPPRPAGRG